MTQLFTREGTPFTGRPATNDKGKVGYDVLSRTCGRCGGLGGSDKWAHTGWTCFQCGGKGKVPCNQFVPLYTAEQNAKLDAAQAKRDATRARKAAEATAVEEARRQGERAACLTRNAELLRRMRAVAIVSADDEGGERIVSPFLADMIDRIAVKALDLTEGQRVAAENACTKIEAENARRAAATHLGTIGERREFVLEYQRCIDLTESRWDPLFMIWVFRCDGCSVVYKGGWPAAFDGLEWEGEGSDRRLLKGSKISIVATVKAHVANRKTGEPETIIQRPKAAKAKAA